MERSVLMYTYFIIIAVINYYVMNYLYKRVQKYKICLSVWSIVNFNLSIKLLFNEHIYIKYYIIL